MRIDPAIFQSGTQFGLSSKCLYQMKVAIPVFGLQVSLRCDCAQHILFLEIESGEIVSRKTASLERMDSLQ